MGGWLEWTDRYNIASAHDAGNRCLRRQRLPASCASFQSEIDDPATYGWTLTIGQLTFAAGPKFGAASAVVRSCTVENALLFHGTTLHSGV